MFRVARILRGGGGGVATAPCTGGPAWIHYYCPLPRNVRSKNFFFLCLSMKLSLLKPVNYSIIHRLFFFSFLHPCFFMSLDVYCTSFFFFLFFNHNVINVRIYKCIYIIVGHLLGIIWFCFMAFETCFGWLGC